MRNNSEVTLSIRSFLGAFVDTFARIFPSCRSLVILTVYRSRNRGVVIVILARVRDDGVAANRNGLRSRVLPVKTVEISFRVCYRNGNARHRPR